MTQDSYHANHACASSMSLSRHSPKVGLCPIAENQVRLLSERVMSITQAHKLVDVLRGMQGLSDGMKDALANKVMICDEGVRDLNCVFNLSFPTTATGEDLKQALEGVKDQRSVGYSLTMLPMGREIISLATSACALRVSLMKHTDKIKNLVDRVEKVKVGATLPTVAQLASCCSNAKAVHVGLQAANLSADSAPELQPAGVAWMQLAEWAVSLFMLEMDEMKLSTQAMALNASGSTALSAVLGSNLRRSVSSLLEATQLITDGGKELSYGLGGLDSAYAVLEKVRALMEVAREDRCLSVCVGHQRRLRVGVPRILV